MAVVCLGETWNITGIGGPAIATFENQRYRASDLNLIVAIITFWNTVYLERAVTVLREHGITNDESLAHLLPIGWEHINLIGDSTKQPTGGLREGAFRPPRPFAASTNHPNSLSVRFRRFVW